MANPQTFTVKIDPADEARLDALLKDFKFNSKAILARALNEAGNKSKTVAATHIRKDINLTSTKVKERLRAPKDTLANTATSNRLTAKLTANRRGFRLYNFKFGKQPGLGTPSFALGVKVKPSGSRKKLPGAFYAKLKRASKDEGENPLLGIFIRTSENKIKHLHGPSVSQVYQEVKDEISEGMQEYLQERLNAAIESKMKRYGTPK